MNVAAARPIVPHPVSLRGKTAAFWASARAFWDSTAAFWASATALWASSGFKDPRATSKGRRRGCTRLDGLRSSIPPCDSASWPATKNCCFRPFRRPTTRRLERPSHHTRGTEWAGVTHKRRYRRRPHFKPSTGTNLDIAATDQVRPIPTTTAIPIHARNCIPLRQ